MNDKEKHLVDISTQTGFSNCLTVLPITEFEFDVSQQQFWDSIRIPYGWEITSLPTTCPCESKFDIQHSMGCKRGDSTANDLNSDLIKISDWVFQWKMRFNPDPKNKLKR